MTAIAGLPPRIAGLGPWCEARVLDPVDVHLAGTIGRLGGEERVQVLLAAALAARAPRRGHVCIDLRHVAGTVVADAPLGRFADREADEPADPASLPWPDPDAWRRILASSSVVAPASDLLARADAVNDGRPLVLDGHRVYLARWWHDEQFVARRLLELAGADEPPTTHADTALEAELDHWFPPLAGNDPDHQRSAARSMLTRRLTVVAGGPGTGKTRTIARALALLHARPDGAPKVALAAPTGKAAARMADALADQLAAAGCDPGTVATVLDTSRPVTLHRLLGLGRRRRAVLDHDLVIVDEASMVSLELVAALLRALPPRARLVLVGDPDQLTSVEAGTVLADLVQSAAAPGDPLADVVVTLHRPYRFEAGSAIAALADAVRGGDVDRAHVVVDTGGDVSFVEHADPLVVPDAAGVRDLVLPTALAAWRAATEGDAPAALATMREVAVLCGHRRGRHGVHLWNRRIEEWLRDAAPGFDPSRPWHVGRPVLVTRNDPITGLANGDTGIVVRHLAGSDDEARSADAVRVAVDVGGVRLFRPLQLPEHETVHATTIHKSQGSEYTSVVVVLPPADSRLTSRELLYTAITRARGRLVLVGSRAALDAGILRRVHRASGLVDALARLAARP